jgi:hypothetical protein
VEGKGPSFFSDGSLQGWFAQVGAVEQEAAANSSCYLFEFESFITQIMHGIQIAGPVF